jgi:hypothetical protein
MTAIEIPRSRSGMVRREDAAAIFVARYGDRFVFGLPPQARPASVPSGYWRPSKRRRWLYRPGHSGGLPAEAEAFNLARELCCVELREGVTGEGANQTMGSMSYVRSILAIAAERLAA